MYMEVSILTTCLPLEIKEAYMTFLFPFAYSKKNKQSFIHTLKNNGYIFFSLNDTELKNQFYGDNILISHEELDQFFYPFVEDKLFPEEHSDNGLLRFSKKYNVNGTFQIRQNTFSFSLLSVDITLCPFEIGIITLRLRMNEKTKELSDVLEFIHHFRVLQAKLEEERGGTLILDNQHYDSTEAFIFNHLIPFMKPFLQINERMAGYYGSLPFFEDERMFSTAFIMSNQHSPIQPEHLFRIGQIDGKTIDGDDYISTTNQHYIQNYIENHVHTRWAPDFYTITSYQAQMSITNNHFFKREKELTHFMSTNYYNVLIHYFYKITLLKLSFEHSEIRWGKDKIVVEKLIELITQFSSRYYFGEIVVRSSGRELAQFLRREFRIDNMFNELRATLTELYRVQADQAKDQQNQMLFMLTVFTVISGIYGMNLVIEDLQGAIDWSRLTAYSIFEWITFITAISGITISIALTIAASIRSIKNYFAKKKL